MRILLPIVAALGVWVAPALGQGGPGTIPPKPIPRKTPTSGLPINPPNTGNTANSRPIPGQTNIPPPPQRRSGLGIFNAPSTNPWAVPPRQNRMSHMPQPQNRMSQMPQPQNRMSQMPFMPPQNNMGWGPQPQTFPNQIRQSMPWLQNQMSVILDRMDVPCGISQRRRRAFGTLIDHPEPFCECRLGLCDGGIPDPSGHADCGNIASCCCTGTPYNNFITATLMQNNLMQAGMPGARPGGMLGARPGQMPAGAMPGMMSGAMPGGMQGAMPGAMPGPPRSQTPTYRDFGMMWYR